MFRKILSVVLCVFMVASSVIPQKNQMVYAYNPDVPETQPVTSVDPIEKYPTTTDADYDISRVALLDEVDSLRTESTKTFQRADGSFVVAMYGDVIHYQKDGKWTDIDNTLTYDQLSDSYENKNNSFKVKFPNSIEANKKIKLTMGDYSINWSISSISRSSIQFSNPEMKSNNIKDLTGISQEVMYENVMKGVDVQYIITGSKVKENIILQSYIENFSLSFDYETKNLQLLSVDNEFLFVNENGEIVFNLTDLYAIDANGVETDNVTIRVDEIAKGKYKVIVSVDDIWLRNATYPVTIDPSISSKVENLSISDTYLKHTWLNANTKYPSSTNIYCNNGNATILTAAYLGYINFVVPSFLKNYDITYATLNIHSYSTTGYGTLYLYELQDYHNLSTLEWTTPRVVGTRVIDYAKIENVGIYYQLDITTSVDKWNKQNLTSMPGFEMKSDGPLLKFYSMEASTYKPFLEIGFMDSEGIKDYWTYSSQDMGSAGTGFVSDFTQELSIVRNDITYETALQSLGVSFAYNNKMSMSSTPNIGYGNGWNINYNMSLHVGEPSSSYYIQDFTGSRSYYSLSTCDFRMDDYTPSICYLSEDGTGDKVVKHLDEYDQLDEIYLITKDNTKYNFNMTFYDLESISSLNNVLTINIVRETSSRQKIDYVTDYRGNKIDFSYGVNGNLDSALLSTIVGEDEFHQLEKVYYSYFENTNYLHDVYYLSNYNQNKNLQLNTANLSNVDKIARYDHYSTKQMNRVFMEYVNETTGTFSYGEDVRYHYVSSTSSQILNYESYYNLEKISQMNYESYFNQTIITDHLGSFVLYKFDRYGHTVNIIGDNGNVIFHEYMDIFIDPSTRINGKYNYDKNHKIVNQSSPQNPVHNPVKNNGFEWSLDDWTEFEEGDANIDTVIDIVKTGNRSLRIRTDDNQYGYVYQTITLDEGIHNIYVDVKNCGLDDDDVYVFINGNSQHAENDSEWHRLTFTIFIDEDDTDVEIRLGSNTTGDVYFDNITYYKDFVSSRVNLVENSSFENGLASWAVDPQADTVYNIYTQNSGTGSLEPLYKKILGNTAVGLKGRITYTLDKNYYEEFYNQSGKLYVGSWAYNKSAPVVNNANFIDGKTFRITIEQFDIFGTPITSHTQHVNFSLAYESWQYVYDEIVLSTNCTSIRISLEYFGEGEVVFDGINIFYLANSTSYEYDQYGRVTKVYQDGVNVYSLTYPTLDEGISITPERIYDQYNNHVDIVQELGVILEVLSNNVKSTSEYNDFGQVTQTLLVSGDDTKEYFDTSTEYSVGTSQFIASRTDEFNSTTYYYYSEVTGLMEQVTNSDNVSGQYEYYDNGMLKKVLIVSSQSQILSSIIYIYNDLDQLVSIQLSEDCDYYITYDNLGRVTQILVNEVPLVTYTYKEDIYETGLVEEKLFGNNDKLIYIYNEDQYLIEIKFQGAGLTEGTTRFQYEYDSFGRIVRYLDLINNVYKEYEYNSTGQLIKVSYNDDESVNYEYDMKGNLSKAVYSVDDYNVSVEYDHIRDSFDPSQYDKTTFDFVDSTILTKMFSYWDNNGEDPLNRLTKILYSMTGLGSFQQNFVYETDHYRIKQTDYYFGESDARNIKYEYQYDSLGNIIEEKTIRFSTINGVYYTSVVKSYEYDDLNQLAIEDVLYNTDPSASYTNIFHYDSRGNLLNLTTYEYGVRDHEIPSFLYNCQCSIPVYMKYNTTKYYTDIYAIEVGQAPQINFSYINPVNQSLYIGVNTVLLSSTLDINSEGYYYNYYRAYNSNQSINIYFRIVIMVGDIDPNKKVSYTYDTDWSDQLVSYGITANGSTVNHILTYDSQGNPTQITNFLYNGIAYNHADLSWDGRELANIKVYSSSGSTTKVAEIWYTYNDQGYRVSKRLDTDGDGEVDKKYVYLLSGDLVLSEIVSLFVNSSWVEDYQINYLFEHDGTAVGFELLDNGVIEHFLYVKNLQGDITQIIRDDGTIVVEYFYDAFGQILAITGSLSTTIGQYNSLRYRSYKYDNELKFYYLNSRYYNPEIGRFISSDGQIGELGNILSTNMYAYCANNPVMYLDPSGETWEQIGTIALYAAITAAVIGLTILTLGAGSAGVIGIVAAVGFGSGAFTSIVTQKIFNGSVDIWQVFLDGFTGSMTACISMLPMGVVGVATFGGLIGIGSYVSSSSYNGTEITTEGMFMSFGIGFVAGLISGGGYGYEKYTKFRYVSGMAKTFISPKKIAMYSLKTNILKSDISGSIARFTISMVFFGGVYTAYQNEELRFDFGGR